MRISRVVVLCGIMISSTIPAMAFYPSGKIDKNLSYDGIEIADSLQVSGKLINRTREPIRVEGAVVFVTIHKQVINYAPIKVTVPSKGSARFQSRLAGSNAKQTRNAFDLKWYLRTYSTPDKPRRPHPNGPNYKKNRSGGYSNTSVSGAYVKVFGKGNQKSDPFELKNGLYVVKVSHVGRHHCRISLVHRDEGLAANITNGGGTILESKNVAIEWGGTFFLDVFADGDWTVSMEYQKPDAPPDWNSEENTPDNGGASIPVVITLKNGRTIHADYYWEAGDKLKASIRGAIMTIEKKDVKDISATTP